MPKLKKLVRYLFSGGISFMTNLLGLFLLVHFAHMYYLLASVLSFLIALTVGFTMQKFWTFRDHATDRMHAQFATFTLVATINLGINTVLMYSFVSLLGVWYLLAQVFAALLIATESYFVYKKFVFQPEEELTRP